MPPGEGARPERTGGPMEAPPRSVVRHRPRLRVVGGVPELVVGNLQGRAPPGMAQRPQRSALPSSPPGPPGLEALGGSGFIPSSTFSGLWIDPNAPRQSLWECVATAKKKRVLDYRQSQSLVELQINLVGSQTKQVFGKTWLDYSPTLVGLQSKTRLDYSAKRMASLDYRNLVGLQCRVVAVIQQSGWITSLNPRKQP